MSIRPSVILVAAAAVLVVGGAAVAVPALVADDGPERAETGLLVDESELAERLDDDDVVVVDARDPEEYAAGAIPGAVSLHTEVLNRTVTLDNGEEVPRIVQEADEISEPLQQAGINADDHVVVYDNGGETSAPRIFWVLEYYGHDRVSVLDGGLAAWEAAGHEVSQSPPQVAQGGFTPQPRPELHADFAYVQEAMYSDSVVLCNALSAESYQEGSIEGSQNLHATSLFADDDVPYFRGDEVLGEFLEQVGHEPGQEFLSFCGSGYMASINYFAARLLGVENVRMYDGSLQDWNARDAEILPEGRA